MGLSNDPEKRARQLANLEKGGQAAAARHSLPAGHGAQGDPATPDTSGPETAGGRDDLPVVDYHDPAPQLEPPPAPAPAAEPSHVDEHDDDERQELEPEVDEEEEVELERYAERGGLGGLMDGFLGR